MDTKKTLNEIFSAALKAVDPFIIAGKYADRIYSEFAKGGFRQIFLTGFGKASSQMAKALQESICADLITKGIVVTKYGHTPVPYGTGPRPELNGTGQTTDDGRRTKDAGSIKIYEAGHPIPDVNGFKAAEEVISLLRTADKNTLVLCLVSGGGSALLVSPYNGISLGEKQMITNLLLRAGADITELNTVRKHLSKVKGGRLAEIAYPAGVISLMISDVIGDKLDVIASGPTAADTSTFREALSVIEKYELTEKTPASVMETLKKGGEGLIPETPKSDNPVFRNVQNIIIGSNLTALKAAEDKAQSLGLKAEILSSDISGEARDIGKWLAEKAIKSRNELRVTQDKKRICLISGGETTVTVKGKGKGGRNTELALSFAKEIQGIDGITFLSAGTDGTDGPTDAAGAVADGKTIAESKSLGLNPDEYLGNNDSYDFFKQVDSLLITGPTGTNVMDIQIALIG